MLARLIIAGALVAHGTIHLLFVAPRPADRPGAAPWPFDLGASWLFPRLGTPPGVVSFVGLALVAATVAGYALAALATLGVLSPVTWDPAVAAGSVASLGLLVLFFHRSLVAGMAIDLALLWIALVAAWSPDVIA